MHIFVATDGTLDLTKTVDTVLHLWHEGDDVTIFTAVRFPRKFMQNYAEIAGVREIAAVADAAGAGPIGISSGARAAERMSEHAAARPVDPKQVSGVQSYFQVVTERSCGPIAAALIERGVDAKTASAPTEDQTARTILAEAERLGADLLVVGHKGEGAFEGFLGSTVTKLVRRSAVSVLVIK